ncbi:arginine--tRNA ligase, partial [Streptomyces sp. MS2A]|nr:arginine--tRNA ligase [Streptomyces sp. MS2A]
MNPAALAEAVLAVLTPISDERRPGEPLGITASDIVLERPRNRDHGDWATNVAMRLAKPFGTNPRELAQRIADGLGAVDGVAEVSVAGPGFINIRLEAGAAGALARTIVEAGPAYGHNES